MSKRQEIKEKRRRERFRNRIVIILMVVIGALLVTFAFVWPTLQDQLNPSVISVTEITPRSFFSPVDGTSMGDPSAPVRLDTWEDFQCPACVNFSFTIMPQIISAYVDTGIVYYTFHHFPFIDDYSTQKESDNAHNAAMCAGEQTRFWDYHDMLYNNWNGENQGAFADVKLQRFAEVINLEMDAFTACFQENRYQAEIDRDFAAGQAAAVNSTPTIFVDMVRVISKSGEMYVPQFEDIAAAIEAALAK